MRKADNLLSSCAAVTISGKRNFLEPSGPVQACNGTDLPLPHIQIGDHGSIVVKVLCYKSVGRWFDPSWCQWIFDIKSFRSHYGPGVKSASNRNEYQEYFLGVKAAGA